LLNYWRIGQLIEPKLGFLEVLTAFDTKTTF